MGSEKPLDTEDLVELGYTSDVAAAARDEIIQLRAENARLLQQNDQLQDVAAMLEIQRAENARLREELEKWKMALSRERALADAKEVLAGKEGR